MSNPTVEQHLEAWATQSPACVVTPSERRFIQDMRQAAMGGVGYGWMQSIIEVEWAWKDPVGALGPAQSWAWLQRAEAETAKLRRALEQVREEVNRPGVGAMDHAMALGVIESLVVDAIGTSQTGSEEKP